MSRDYQQYQDYQYGNNEQYFYNNPQQAYYPNYAPQGEYYGPPGHGAQAYGAQYDYGPYTNLNYYTNYPQPDNYYDPNAYGYDGEYYQGASQTAEGGQGGQVGTDGNGAVKQQVRGKHSYSQNRNRNRQRTDVQFQGEAGARDGTGKAVKEGDKNIAGNDENAVAARSNDTSHGNVRGKKQGGRFYGSDSRSKPFERRFERHGDSVVREVDSYQNGLRADVDEFENKSESKKGYRQLREEPKKSERSKNDKYGKENLSDKHRYSSRRDDKTDKSGKQALDENVNNNSTSREYGRQANSQLSGVLKVDLRKDYSGGDETSNKEKKDDDDSSTFDYRNEGGLSQKHQGRHQRRMPRNKATKKVDESQRGVLIDQLTRGTYECMVCCETVRAQNAVWSCSNCFHVFHLRCIKQWARSPNAIVSDAKKDNKGVSNHYPHREHWDLQHTIFKFNTECQTNVKTMDSYCNDLLTKLKHRIRTHLKIPDLQRRRMNKEVLCVSTNPITIDWYDPTQQLCCNGVHRKISGHEMCCGSKSFKDDNNQSIYDGTQYLCCDGILYNKTTPSLECCGKDVYVNTSITACCNNVLYDPRRKYCCAGKTLHHNIGRQNKNGGCCGENIFDDRCSMCINKTEIRPRFDPDFQRCCHGNIIQIKFNKTVCCGRLLMDENKYHCIDNDIVTKDPNIRTVTEQNGSLQTSNAWSEANLFSKVVGLIAIILILINVVYICKRKRHTFNLHKRSLSEGRVSFKKTVEIIPASKGTSFADGYSESGLESGYQSLRQTPSLKSEVSFDSIYTTTDAEFEDEQVTEQTCVVEVSEVFNDIPDISICYEKPRTNHDSNLTSELFSDAETQTIKQKESNMRDVFGNVFKHTQYLDKFNRTVQWDRSDSKMTVPASVITDHNLLIHASSFDNIPAIYKKFSLSADKRLASPVVEYCFTGCKSLIDHALVELPILTGDTEVYKFSSDCGIDQIAELRPIRVLEKEDFSFDTFCIIKRDKVLIYTKTFTGFICINHGSRTNFNLKAFLFASYKKVMQNPEVRLNLYIADELHNFTDYNQSMTDIEEGEGREKYAVKPLDLPECARGQELNGDDYLEITAIVQSEMADEWEHKPHPTENRPLEKELKVVKLKNLTRCCQSENCLPHPVAWCFINKSRAPPSSVVQVVVDVTCKLSDHRAEETRTPLYIDELKIRESDRAEVPTDCQRVTELKHFLTQYTQPQKRDSILAQLNQYMRRLDSTVAPIDNLVNILNAMERLLHPIDFMRSVIDILTELKAFDLLDILVDNKLIHGHLLHKPVQPEQTNTSNGPQCIGGVSSNTSNGPHCIGGASSIPSLESSTFRNDSSTIVKEPYAFVNLPSAVSIVSSVNDSDTLAIGNETSTVGDETSAKGTFAQGPCRPEMDTINKCSFDKNNEETTGHTAQVSRPRPELQNYSNGHAILEQSPVIYSMGQQDDSSVDSETEPKISELYISDSD